MDKSGYPKSEPSSTHLLPIPVVNLGRAPKFYRGAPNAFFLKFKTRQTPWRTSPL